MTAVLGSAIVAHKVSADSDQSKEVTQTAAPSDSGTSPREPDDPLPAPLQYRDRSRYEMLDEHGRGGLGRVMRARDRELGRDVAVKELLHRGHAAELRFFREALVTARLEHPGIVPVHEAGRWTDGTPFYAMKLVSGRSLKSLLEQHATLEERLRFLPNIIAVADAMAYAHQHGIIHRDLKPSNVMIGEHGETIVIDWGLAKALDEAPDVRSAPSPYRSTARDELTVAGSVLGTPAYMAPEQCGGHVDHRADVYALGGILFHLLSGRAPHDSSGTNEPPSPPVLRFTRQTPNDLIAITARAMAQDPAGRYATSQELAEDLRRFNRRDRVSARKYSLVARLGLAFARHRAVWLAVTAALVALAITLSISLFTILRGLHKAEAAREEAVVANAAALLDRDPTSASQMLATIDAEVAPLLRARIRAAGVAERTIALPGRFDRQEVTAGGDVVVGTSDRTLSVIDLRTGNLRPLVGGLTESSIWASMGNTVYFVRQNQGLELARVSIADGTASTLTKLDGPPHGLRASSAGIFWLHGDGSLWSYGTGGQAHAIAHGVAYYDTLGDRLVVCDRDGSLRIGQPELLGAPAGACNSTGPLVANATELIYTAANGSLVRYRDGGMHRLDGIDSATLELLAISDTGLVGGYTTSGDGILVRPRNDAIERVALDSHAALVKARGAFVAWGRDDGSIEVIDTASGREWSIQSGPETPWCMVLLPDERLLTCRRSEI